MRKSLLLSVIAILSCLIVSAFAGVGTPIFLTDGVIDESTLPIIAYSDLFNPGVPEIYGVEDARTGVVGYRGSFRIEPHSWSAQPVQEGNIPTAEHRLLNPDKPVTVFVYGCGDLNQLSLNLDFYQDNGNGRLSMRVLDSDGKPLASVNAKDNPSEKPAFIALGAVNESKIIYLELSDPDKKGDRYCYIALDVKVLDSSSRMSREMIEAYTTLMRFKVKYAQDHNITDMGRLKKQDFKIIFDQTNNELGYFAFDVSKLDDDNTEPEESSTKQSDSPKKSKKATKTRTSKSKRTSK